MNLSITLRHGPLDIEIEGENREEIQDGILGLADFFEEHGDSLAQFDAPVRTDNEASNGETQTDLGGFANSESSENFSDSSMNSQAQYDERYDQIVQETRIDGNSLSELINLPDDEGEVPSINTYHFDIGTEILGSARNQRQSQASAILLYVWDVCLGEKKIKFDTLDQALTASDIETEQRKNMYSAFSGDAGDWFESDGGSIWIIGPGKTHVRELLEELNEKKQN